MQPLVRLSWGSTAYILFIRLLHSRKKITKSTGGRLAIEGRILYNQTDCIDLLPENTGGIPVHCFTNFLKIMRCPADLQHIKERF